VSGGGKRGEIRVRKAGPTPKQAGGTHNRKARRASKATQRELFTPAPFDAEAFAQKREARRRAAREAFWAGQTDADIEALSLEQSERESGALGGQWFLPLFLDAVPRWATRHFTTDPDARVKRAHELGELLAYSQGAAAVVDPDARGTEHEGDVAEIFNAVAEGLAIGAYCPGGTPGFSGMKWEVVGNELRLTHGRFCARYPVNDPGYWDTEPCSNLIEATLIYAAEAG
jgi:hypothetical protein